MNYDNFEQHIHALILQRGKGYFDTGKVAEIEGTADGWVLEVEGQNTYRVVLKGIGQLEDWFCECPHDHGPVCKHVAAAMYAVRAQQGQRIDQILDRLPVAELKAIIHRHVSQSPHLLQTLEDRYNSVHLFEEE